MMYQDKKCLSVYFSIAVSYYSRFAVSNFYYKQPFDQLLQRAIEHGFMKHFQRKTDWIIGTADSMGTHSLKTADSSSINVMNFSEFWILLMIYVYGCCIAFSILVLEICLKVG